MTIEFRELTPNDYEQLVELWEHQKIIGDIPCAKTREAYERYLAHNACLSLGAMDEEKLVGAILCGQQAKHAMIEHVTLHETYLSHNEGAPLINRLIHRAMNKLIRHGYTKCTITIAEESIERNFWNSIRWVGQPDLSDFTTVDHIKLQEYQDHEAALLLQTDNPLHDMQAFEKRQTSDKNPITEDAITDALVDEGSQDEKAA